MRCPNCSAKLALFADFEQKTDQNSKAQEVMRRKALDYLDKSFEISKTELARELGISYRDPRFQRLIKRMAHAGEISVSPSSKDRRIHLLRRVKKAPRRPRFVSKRVLLKRQLRGRVEAR